MPESGRCFRCDRPSSVDVRPIEADHLARFVEPDSASKSLDSRRGGGLFGANCSIRTASNQEIAGDSRELERETRQRGGILRTDRLIQPSPFPCLYSEQFLADSLMPRAPLSLVGAP